jgi:hypothetical protein
MEKLFPKRKVFNRPTIGFIAIIVIAMYAFFNELLNTSLLILFIVSLSIFNYITSIALYHYFLYNEKSVTVKNKWFPLINDVHYIVDILDVKLTIQTNVGFSVLFYFKNGKKKVYGIQAKKEDIEEMINFIKAEIEKNN